MPTSNPYPERAIASFVLVGAMGVALLFVGAPAESRAQSPVIAQDEPEEPRSHVPAQAPASPGAPAVATPSAPPVFSEAAARHGVETTMSPTSSAPETTQGALLPAPAAPVPAEETPPDEDPGLLTCATPVVILNKLLCSSE